MISSHQSTNFLISPRISIYTFMYFITTQFHEILTRGIFALTKCFSNIFHFGKILCSKGAWLPGNKLNQIFLHICAYTLQVLHNYKISRNSVELFHWWWFALTKKKNRIDGLTYWLIDGLTDRLTDESNTRCVGYNKFVYHYQSIDIFINGVYLDDVKSAPPHTSWLNNDRSVSAYILVLSEVILMASLLFVIFFTIFERGDIPNLLVLLILLPWWSKSPVISFLSFTSVKRKTGQGKQFINLSKIFTSLLFEKLSVINPTT